MKSYVASLHFLCFKHIWVFQFMLTSQSLSGRTPLSDRSVDVKPPEPRRSEISLSPTSPPPPPQPVGIGPTLHRSFPLLSGKAGSIITQYRNWIYFPIFRKARPSFFRVLPQKWRVLNVTNLKYGKYDTTNEKINDNKRLSSSRAK